MSENKKSLNSLMLMALGVVFGDIGTSPLYALRECFGEHSHLPLNQSSIMGVLSLIIWSLIIIISMKYLAFVMRAHNKGEGGVLALTALIIRKLLKGGKNASALTTSVAVIGIFGSALLYADGVITPAISVLSAIEGLTIVTPIFNDYIIPISLIVLMLLFGIQSYGTSTIGYFFGPIVTVWFVLIGFFGLLKVLSFPEILLSFNPIYAIVFFSQYKFFAFASLGALFLVVTGAEACYADMGHFGVKPISRAWFFIVFPSLVLNYLGQGALLLSDHKTIESPFYHLVPKSMLIPMVILATLTSAIASQAVISGAFSLTRQAIQLGYLPRMLIQHTSATHQGQIYIPNVNTWLSIGTFMLVVFFKNSSNLAAAYGIAVSSTMLLTTILMFVVCVKVWKWNLVIATFLFFVLLVPDLFFVFANSIKFAHGGWFPILIGLFLFILMTTWAKGRRILAQKLEEKSIPLLEFIKQVSTLTELKRVKGVSVFMSRTSSFAPAALMHNVVHNQVLHEVVLLLTIQTERVPFVPESEQLRISDLENGFYRVIASIGFQEEADINNIIQGCAKRGVPISGNLTYFLGREILKVSKESTMSKWRQKLFCLTSKNAQSASDFYKVPSENIFEVGIQVEL